MSKKKNSSLNSKSDKFIVKDESVILKITFQEAMQKALSTSIPKKTKKKEK